MRKLKLEIELLAIQSFETDTGSGEAVGTVHGHGNTRNRDTCDASCFGSCAYTCQYTCKCQPTQPEETCLYPCVPPPP